MNLEEFAEIYFQNHEFGIAISSQKCFYLPAARQFLQATKCDDIQRINQTVANQFVDWLKSRPISPATQHTRRRGFVVLWKAAYDKGLCPVYDECRKIKVPKRAPRAWHIDSIRKLMTDTLADGSIWTQGIASSSYWGSLFAASWDTGYRLGDLLNIEYKSIERDPSTGSGLLNLVCSKVQREHISNLNPQTMKLIDRCMLEQPKRSLIWPLRSDRRQFYRDAKKRFTDSGLSGTFRFLRRSAVTYAESISPGMGQKLAGHKDSRVTWESYIDPRLLPECTVILPPVL
ncbi:hypothetical protein VN12_20870 [Pirellula sp. SH-Sr6A]|nr:hypothetical protein VN12_20870 [Pirellula sp. SH-Sr6A]